MVWLVFDGIDAMSSYDTIRSCNDVDVTFTFAAMVQRQWLFQ